MGDSIGPTPGPPAQPILLIGPIGAGKSTIGRLLAARLGLPRISLDEERWRYYREIGYDEVYAERIQSQEGLEMALRYWKPFEAHAVLRVVEEFRAGVIDFGAGHSVYEDETLFARVASALAPLPNVILLLPSPDPGVSLAILNERLSALLQGKGQALNEVLIGINEHFLTHPSNHRLAKQVVYTGGQSPDESCAAILRLLGDADIAP